MMNWKIKIGPSYWRVMHVVSLSSIDEIKKKEIIIKIIKSIKCQECKSKTLYQFENRPTNQKIQDWLFRYHNSINLFLQKPQYKYGILQQYKDLLVVMRILTKDLYLIYRFSDLPLQFFEEIVKVCYPVNCLILIVNNFFEKQDLNIIENVKKS